MKDPMAYLSELGRSVEPTPTYHTGRLGRRNGEALALSRIHAPGLLHGRTSGHVARRYLSDHGWCNPPALGFDRDRIGSRLERYRYRNVPAGCDKTIENPDIVHVDGDLVPINELWIAEGEGDVPAVNGYVL